VKRLVEQKEEKAKRVHGQRPTRRGMKKESSKEKEKQQNRSPMKKTSTKGFDWDLKKKSAAQNGLEKP